VALAVLAGSLLVSCDAGEDPSPAASAADRAPLVADGASLLPASEWRLLSVDLEQLVTPRWSPSGDMILARGARGVGLFVLSAADGSLLHAEDGYRGDAAFDADGAICRGPRAGGRLLRFDPETGQGVASATPCLAETRDERLGALLHDGPDGAVYHHEYLGTVTRVTTDGEEVQLENRGAWNVAVSPDGRRIAWCLGTLAEPALLLHDLGDGVTDLGRGAHPSWSPESRYLVFASPRVVDLQGGGHAYDSDLFAYDADLRTRTRLTATPGVAELQPAVSPDGRALAFADWEGDALYVAPIRGLGREGGER
jgi:Tol biopolymer transport system component